MKLLRGTRVIELDGPYGSSCARFLGSLGAEVIKVVAPGASACSGEAPGASDDAGAIDAAFQRYEDADKQCVVLDLERPDGVETLRALTARADFLIESAPVGYLAARGLDYAALSAVHPRIIHASITAFGAVGPYAQYRGSELVASAMGGVLRTLGGAGDAAGVPGATDVPEATGVPIKEALDACIFQAGAAAAAALMLAYHELRRSGRGQHVDVSLHEVTASRSARSLLRWQFARAQQCAEAAQPPAPRDGADAGGSLLRWLRTTRDGDGAEASFLRALDLTHARGAARADASSPLRGTTRVDGEVMMPGRFVRVAAPAPRAHGSLHTPRPRETRGVSHAFSWDVQRGAPRCGALVGVKVLDLSVGVASALATKALAEHGAQVVKLESSARVPDDAAWRAHLDASKLSLRLHPTHALAHEVLEPLIDWADVLVESELPPGRGLDAALARATAPFDLASVQARRPELVVLRARPHPAALAGMAMLRGGPSALAASEQLGYDDALLAPFMIAAVAAALAQRRRTGVGCRIDASAHELCAHQLARALLAAQLDAPLPRSGNRDPRVLWQGVYPARGSQRFIAITLFDADDLRRFAELTGGSFPDAAQIAAGDAALGDALDARIAEFTRTRDDHALMHALQAHGIAAGVVQDADDLLARDRQLAARGALVQLSHPQLGRFAHQASPYSLGSSPSSLRTAPLPGQHTEYVCRDLLGLDPEHIRALQTVELFF